MNRNFHKSLAKHMPESIAQVLADFEFFGEPERRGGGGSRSLSRSHGVSYKQSSFSWSSSCWSFLDNEGERRSHGELLVSVDAKYFEANTKNVRETISLIIKGHFHGGQPEGVWEIVDADTSGAVATCKWVDGRPFPSFLADNQIRQKLIEDVLKCFRPKSP